MSEDNDIPGNYSPADREQLIVISGCSSGGKSTLLAEMARRGYTVFPEPGRQIVKEALFIGSDALPWQDGAKFTELCVSRAMHFYNSARPAGCPVLFDRSMVDNITGMQRAGRPMPPGFVAALSLYRYARRVFMTPPWEELFVSDRERRHGFAAAVTEYQGLLQSYPANGYDVVLIPKAPVAARADFLEAQIARH